jgi:hypothetical protein
MPGLQGPGIRHSLKGQAMSESTTDDDHRLLPITMDKRVDLALALGCVLLGAAAAWIATGFRIGNYPDPLTSRGLPYSLGGFLVAGGGVLAARRLNGWRQLPGNLVVSEGTEDETGHPADSRRSFAVMACGFLWAVLLMPAGYLIATPVALSGMMLAMDVRSWRRVILFPAGFTAVTWVIFAQMLNVLLPLGPLAPLARRLGLMY